MTLVARPGMLPDAQKQGYALGAFNIENMEMAVIERGAIQKTEFTPGGARRHARAATSESTL